MHKYNTFARAFSRIDLHVRTYLEKDTEKEGTTNNGECIVPVRLQPLQGVTQILFRENIV